MASMVQQYVGGCWRGAARCRPAWRALTRPSPELYVVMGVTSKHLGEVVQELLQVHPRLPKVLQREHRGGVRYHETTAGRLQHP